MDQPMSAQHDTKRPLRSERWPFRLLLRLLPLSVWRTLRYELRLTWLRLTRRGLDARFARSKQLFVNVGCGSFGRHGWINIDCFPANGVTIVRDCRTSLPLATGSARGVFAEHFLEHLHYDDQALLFLAECLRVLQPGGILRIIVPDGEKYLRAYASCGWEELRSFSPLVYAEMPYKTKMEVVNAHFRQGGQHHFSYDYETLARLLERAGFQTVCRQSFRSSSLPEIAIDSESRASESLVIEGQAPCE